jgi:enamine deaminase RidA (YjgF/YER057c/UK114 family)
MIHGPPTARRIAASPRVMTETIRTHGCAIVLRRVEGPFAREIFLHCGSPRDVADPGRQATAMYRAIQSVLEAEGGGFGFVVAETIFLRNLGANIAPVRAARRRVLATCDAAEHRPATLEIEQPPLDERAGLEVSVQAVVPNGTPLRMERVSASPACGCSDCAGARGLELHVGGESRFHAAGLRGAGDDAHEQTLAMFGLAEDLLHRAGMEFRDVVRTWIHLRHMDRDYATFNRARREFFAARGIEPVPASTGIGGGLPGDAHDLCLGIYAVKSGQPLVRTVMTTPTLNEAREYGADFVRGMRIEEANRVALHVSGTASLDEHGRSVHLGDVDAQADRMLLNIAALLERQGARYADVVHAITYVKHSADAERVRARLRAAGFAGFPHAVVVAPICRPELLCETEALAVLPRAASTAG